MDDKEQIGAAIVDEDKQIIHSAVNENDWKLECERVANKLKVQNKQQDNKEWRTHVESTRTCGEHIKKKYPVSNSLVSPRPEPSWKNSTTISPKPSTRSPNLKGSSIPT